MKATILLTIGLFFLQTYSTMTRKNNSLEIKPQLAIEMGNNTYQESPQFLKLFFNFM